VAVSSEKDNSRFDSIKDGVFILTAERLSASQ
jgi:hypothetical protein